MMRRVQLWIAVLGAAAGFAAATWAAAPASAAGNPVVSDCVDHGALTRTYTVAQLHHALATMSPTTREYTSCPDVINRALALAISGKGGNGTGGSGSGSFLPTPVIVILVVLVLGAVTFGAVAVRRRRAGGEGGPGAAGSAGL